MQSKLWSTAEAGANVVVGYPLTFAVYLWLAPLLLGIHVSPSQSVGLVVLFTAVSFLRQYFVRRVFAAIEDWSARNESHAGLNSRVE